MYQQAQLYNSSPGFIRSGRSSLLRHAPSGVVRVSEAARAWGRPTSSASRRLGALTRSGWIRRVRRGVYQTDPLPDSPPRSFISSFAIARGARTAQRHATKPEKGDAAKRRGSIRARLRASDEAQTGAWFYKPISHALGALGFYTLLAAPLVVAWLSGFTHGSLFSSGLPNRKATNRALDDAMGLRAPESPSHGRSSARDSR